MNRSAPLACLSARQRAARLTELYPSPIVREHMVSVCGDLMTWAAVRGRHDEARTWLGLAEVLLSSLATRKTKPRKVTP